MLAAAKTRLAGISVRPEIRRRRLSTWPPSADDLRDHHRIAISSQSRILAPFTGTVIAIAHAPGDPVAVGSAIVILEAMRMEHEVIAEVDGVVREIEVEIGDTVDDRSAATKGSRS